MKPITKSAIVLSLTMANFSPLYALVEEVVDTKSSVEVTLSTTSPNRIMFEGGSITDMVLDENKFHSFLHQKTGQAFLTPLEEMKDNPTSVTVITSSGDAQTLSISAMPMPGEVIVLKEASSDVSKSEPLSSDYHSSTIEFLNDILMGKVPQGYGVRSLEGRSFSLEDPFSSKLIRLLEGPFEEIMVVEIENRSKKGIPLDVNRLKATEDLWVFVSQSFLDSGEKTLALIATKKRV